MYPSSPGGWTDLCCLANSASHRVPGHNRIRCRLPGCIGCALFCRQLSAPQQQRRTGRADPKQRHRACCRGRSSKSSKCRKLIPTETRKQGGLSISVFRPITLISRYLPRYRQSSGWGRCSRGTFRIPLNRENCERREGKRPDRHCI